MSLISRDLVRVLGSTDIALVKTGPIAVAAERGIHTTSGGKFQTTTGATNNDIVRPGVAES